MKNPQIQLLVCKHFDGSSKYNLNHTLYVSDADTYNDAVRALNELKHVVNAVNQANSANNGENNMDTF